MTTPAPPLRLHATCVSLGGQGVLITGPSGCGKSDVALRLLDAHRDTAPALLVADDYVELTRTPEGGLLATCPAPLRGLIEARYVGVLATAFHPSSIPVALVLEPCLTPERMPEPLTHSFLGVLLPALRLPYFEASTPAKIRLWAAQLATTTPVRS